MRTLQSITSVILLRLGIDGAMASIGYRLMFSLLVEIGILRWDGAVFLYHVGIALERAFRRVLYFDDVFPPVVVI